MNNRFVKMVSKSIIVLILIFAIIVITTFPLIFRIGKNIPGFFSTDESFAILWNAWFNKLTFINHLSVKNTNLLAYPFGVTLFSNNFVGYLWFGINYVLSILTTPVLVYNLQVIFNLFLTAFFTYVLAYYLTKDKLASLFSSLAFGFCPYMFVRSWQHLGETYLWPMSLFLWILFRLKDENNLRLKIIFVLTLVIATVNFDITYYLVIILILFLIYLLFNLRKNAEYFKNIIFLSFIVGIIFVFQFLPLLKSIFLRNLGLPSAHNLYLRPFEDLFTQSAKPLSYFLPAVAHPLFGDFTKNFIGSPLYGISFTEHTLYLGWITLILAFIVFKKFCKEKLMVPHNRAKTFSSSDIFFVGFFLLLAIVFWLFSQPPWWEIGKLRIFMPSFFMYKILPMFRAYSRFGVVVMLAVSVLAGFGLKFILDKFKTQRIKIAVSTIFCGLILFEFWNYPPFKVIDVSKMPAVYYWLKEQPKDIVIAEYPLDTDSPNEMFRLYQTVHEKKIINYTIPGTRANKLAKSISKLSDLKTSKVLKWIGVKLVLVHRSDYLSTGLIESSQDLATISKNPGLRLIKSFPGQNCPEQGIKCTQETGPIDVYEVIALPFKPGLFYDKIDLKN